MEAKSENINYYSVLDVTADASFNDVYKAYLKAKKTFSLGNSEIYQVFTQREAIDWLSMVEEAYSVIGNHERRKIYDSQMLLNTQSRNMPKFRYKPDEPKKIAKPLNQPKPDHNNPAAFAKTTTVNYPIDQDFETRIGNCEEFSGDFLSRIRRYKRIDLEDFSTKTCIAMRYLYAIENDNYSALPASVFVRGYITQYCKLLQLDEAVVIPSFMQLYMNGRSAQ